MPTLTDFNPRSPCGERREFHFEWEPMQEISIHAPRVGSDGGSAKRADAVNISIHAPRVGSDVVRRCSCRARGISIHAPRVGSDPVPPRAGTPEEYFNPRSPCGERQYFEEATV